MATLETLGAFDHNISPKSDEMRSNPNVAYNTIITHSVMLNVTQTEEM